MSPTERGVAAELVALLASSEAWVARRVMDYARERGFTRHIVAPDELWRRIVKSISGILTEGCSRDAESLELDPDEDVSSDPLTAFGILEARTHWARGVSIPMFLSLLKYFRQAYLDLLWEAGWEPGPIREATRTLTRIFDRFEIGFLSQWASTDGERRLSELQEMNRRLSEERGRYRTLVEHMGEGLGIVDEIEVFVFANRAAERIFGVPEDSLVGQSLMPFLAPGQEKAVETQTAKRSAGDSSSYELEIVRPGGERRWLTVTATPQSDSGGKVVGTFGIFRDVTDQRRAEEDLTYQVYFQRVAAEAFPAPLFVKDLSGVYLNCNRAFAVFAGLSRKAILGKTAGDLFPPDQARGEAEGDRDALSREAGVINEARWLRGDGESRTVEIHKASYKDRAGRPGGVVGVLIDVTERERMVERLTEANLVVEESPTVLLRCGASAGWPVEFVSENIARFGYDAQDLQGRAYPFERLVAPGDLPGLRAEVAKFLASRETAFQGEFRFIRRSGEVVWVEGCSTRVQDPGGKVLGFHCTLTDIGARHRAEEDRARLMQAVEHSAECVVITDTEGTIQYVNRAFTDVTGYTREEAVGQNPRILKSGEQDEGFYRDMWAAISSGKTWRGRFKNKKKDGTHFTEEASITPVVGADGNITNYIAVKRDMTREIVLEEELHHSQRLESVGRLAGGVAHDFNNVMTAIINCADLSLDASGVPGEVAAHLKEIRAAASRAASLTGQLLAFGRKQILQPKELDLGETVERAASMLRRVLPENVILESKVQPGLPPVKADPGQMDQILLNLAINAKDAMPRGGSLLLEVALEEAAGEGGESPSPLKLVRLTVADTGTGMPQDVIDHIFEPFFTTKERGRGSGLGLSTVYGIVKQSGGEIRTDSRPGEGTSFHILLPAMERAPEEAPAPAPGAGRSAVGPLHILLVEDEEQVRRAAAMVLEHLGHSVVEAEGVESGRRVFAAEPDRVDLLLTDMVMPDGSGTDLYGHLSQVKPGLMVVFMSGYTDDMLIRSGALAPHMAFLPKPFTASSLREKIREVVAAGSGAGGSGGGERRGDHG